MHSDLEQEFDASFFKREQIAQRIGRFAILAIVVAAVIGVFGSGLLSQGTIRHESAGNQLELSYPRLGRAHSPLSMSLTVLAPQQEALELTVSLGGGFLDKAMISGITPEPDSVALEDESAVYGWDVEDWDEPLVVTLEYESQQWLDLEGRLAVSAGDDDLGTFSFTQFMFP